MRKFAWIDLETTGLDENKCQILELACVITDENCNVLGEYETIINPGQVSYEEGAAAMHKRSGLITKIASGKPLADVESEVLGLFKSIEPRKRRLYLAGSSVHFDARFMRKYMPSVMEHLCSRYLDVNALNLAFNSWLGDRANMAVSKSHRAMDDIKSSIVEFAFYRQNFVKGV